MNRHRVLMLSLTGSFVLIQTLVMFGLVGKEYSGFVRSTAVSTCLIIVYTFLENKYQIFMNNYVRAVVLVSIFCDSFFGQYLEYYITSTLFDKALHVFGTYSFSLFFYILVIQLLSNPLKRYFKFILVTSLGLSLGAFYEITEFFVDITTKPSVPGQPSLFDTDLDLVANAIGAIIAAIHATFFKLDSKIGKRGTF